MSDLSEIYRKDDLLFEAVQKIPLDDALKCFNAAGFPKTGQVMTSFLGKTGFLKTAIFDLCEVDNIYAVKIIFRSLIEHILKAQYIFMKWAEIRSDQIGEHYTDWYQAAELYDYFKSLEAVSKLSSNNTNNDPCALIAQVFPEFKDKPIKDIKSISSQFNYRSIINYIYEQLNKAQSTEASPFLLKIIPNYSELSGYVHGGPTANKDLLTVYTNEQERQNEILEIAELTLSMVGSVPRWLTLMLVNLDDSYKNHFLRIEKVLQEL